VVFVAEIPKTATGKVRRFRVRELIAHLDVDRPTAAEQSATPTPGVLS